MFLTPLPFIIEVFSRGDGMLGILYALLIGSIVFFSLWLDRKQKYALSGWIIIPLASLFEIAILLQVPQIPLALLFIFPYPAISFFLLGKSRGLIFNFLFLVLIIGAVLFLLPDFRGIEYLNNYAHRIITIYLIVVILSYILEGYREKANIQLKAAALTDNLTNLYNRSFLEEKIEELITRNQGSKGTSVLLILDLDQFMRINDNFGHDVGNEILREVALRLKQSLRDGDLVARLGGDEFAILLAPAKQVEQQVAIASRILNSLRGPFIIGDHELNLSASIGMASYPQDSKNRKELFRNAELALIQAKMAGRSCFRQYVAEYAEHNKKIIRIETLLRQALEKREFTVVYQPRIDIISGKPVGFEALLRWRNDELGSVPPSVFIPIAEDCGLIHPIGRWTYLEAVRHLKELQEAGFPDFTLSVNISPAQFRSPTLIHHLSAVTEETGVDPKCIELEITEGLLLETENSIIKAFETLKSMGFRLAIDDFGTGYSSLSYIKKFNVDTIKIDREFVLKMESDADYLEIVKAIIAMAQSLKIETVAEGVEEESQRTELESAGCNQIQGYYYSKPLPFDKLQSYLAETTNTKVTSASIS
jgi:diguanylate cyclase (GGDEF)-like protein